VLRGADWAINAIGIIKPHIRDDNAAEVERAIEVNGLFPHRLARAAEQSGTRVIQIATDCVYSGLRGAYVERDEHDPRDVYGRTKSLGEVHSPAVHHVRVSIIGPELAHHLSLLDWFLNQPRAAAVKGFVNHRWNGVTTLQFGRLCAGVIRSGLALPHLVHVVPGDIITKADLLAVVASAYERTDVRIDRVDAATVIDRTLDTVQPDLNRALWLAAGYAAPPTIETMVFELARAGRVRPDGSVVDA
jgi:dTDP-4-dehydrorhamnose reductase